MDFLTARPCTGNSYVVYPSRLYELPLAECGRVLKKNGCKVRESGFMIDIDLPGHTCTLYRTGRLLVNPCVDEETALQQANRIFGLIEKNPRLSLLLKERGALL